ncbi:Indigoidine synthase A like protein-domain-containing protein [Aspergillus pseudonomiae]|uniref:Indigoidine synthase A like protein-domain-containing protein n=1 Tax=Aspergillus pseudonomiae TaxID=1506151 RepID=A0A5N6IBG9_9EURO|nr:Indigoidine synthase A like protein-domain-containing protein [Aspergillus pseudonomiae]KAB8263776.1 Indigoidine synthase A like protein-domain-containing protein [Aspergillus pseudonomiae]KAE8400386.1 Indigoidine synthase A like protein-domain-containing protein [Aspergillus pseudonomiae]
MLASRAAARHCCRRARVPASAFPARHLHGLAQSKFLQVSEEVRDAVATGKPVVALESTIYTHGFPYPESVALASLLETVVRANGGVPATIGILNGVAKVGLNAEELIELASTAESKNALKVSRRDLGYICGLGLAGKRLHGGTTVSGTMILAHLAGIKVFGTGGLGGVHRGGENSMDISADLTELGRTPVAVVSSGCKSFLDIPRTLEYLETEGVCVGTFADGRTGQIDFPAFFTRDSGIKSPKVIQDEAEAAAIIYAQLKLPVSSGMHFANPVPVQQSIPKNEMDDIIEEAIRLAEVEGHQGSDNTPFVLSKIKQLSGGKSVTANRALVEANVQRATRVAVELSKLEQSNGTLNERHMPAISEDVKADQATSEAELKLNPTTEGPIEALDKVDVLVAGSLAVDLSCDYAPPAGEKDIKPVSDTSNPATITQSLGGVGHNVAIATKYLGSSVLFCSVVGDDLSGRAALTALRKEGLSTAGVQVLPASNGARTAQYVAVNDAKKDLVVAMADMGIMELPEQNLDFEGFWETLLSRTRPQWVVVDSNWSPEVLSKWVAVAKKYGARVAFEPVSNAKSRRLFSKSTEVDAAISSSASVPNNAISLATPNQFELTTMYTAARESGLFDSEGWWHIIDAMGMSSAGARDRLVAMTSNQLVDQGIPQQSIQLLPYIPCLITKLGSQGVLVTQLLRPGDPRLTSPDSAPYILSRSALADELVGGVYMRLFPPAAVLADEEIVSVNGAGDTLLGAVISGLAKGAKTVEDVIPFAQEASLRTLKSPGGVSSDIVSLARS